LLPADVVLELEEEPEDEEPEDVVLAPALSPLDSFFAADPLDEEEPDRLSVR
jgi:hypothetical protein